MIKDTGTIEENGKVIGQVQIVESGDVKRVQLYTSNGVYVCDCPYEGDNDTGYLIGMGMYRAYQAAWKNAKTFFQSKVNEALSKKGMLELGAFDGD